MGTKKEVRNTDIHEKTMGSKKAKDKLTVLVNTDAVDVARGPDVCCSVATRSLQTATDVSGERNVCLHYLLFEL
jgi:hypothetical protein